MVGWFVVELYLVARSGTLLVKSEIWEARCRGARADTLSFIRAMPNGARQFRVYPRARVHRLRPSFRLHRHLAMHRLWARSNAMEEPPV